MAKPFSLLVVGTNWPIETFLERLLRGLAEHDIRITLATSRKPDAQWLKKTGVKWLYVPSWQGKELRSVLYFVFLFLRRLFFSFKDIRIFATHLSGLNWKSKIVRWFGLIPFAGKRWSVVYFPWNSAAVQYLPLFDLGMPIVLSCRGSQINVAQHNPERQEFIKQVKVTFERVSLVHCVSEDILNKSVSLGLDHQNGVVIRPAVDTLFFLPSSIVRGKDDMFRVTMVGSLVWVKGYEYALLAIRQLADMNVPVLFTIVGDGPERSRILFTIEDLGISDQVQLLGRRSPEQVREILHNTDTFLLSSLSEGISNAALEAMACGLPVVTTDCGGMREAVRDEVEGCVVPVRDSHGMAKALVDLWQSPEKRKQMGCAARERVLSEFDLNNQIKQWISLYQTVIDHT